MKHEHMKMMADIIRIRMDARSRFRSRKDGSEGSGNWGHEGRPGEVGGSAEGGGSQNRFTDENGHYTSLSKDRKQMATPHEISANEFFHAKAEKGAVIINKSGRFMSDGFHFRNTKTGELLTSSHAGNGKLIIPQKNINFSLSKEDREAISIGKQSFESAFNPTDGMDAYDAYVDQSSKVWGECSAQDKSAFTSYTLGGYEDINGALRSGEPNGGVTDQEIDSITAAIDKTALNRDAVFYRGINGSGSEKFLGLPEGFLSKAGSGSLVGKIITDDAFMSAGSSKGTGFKEKCTFEIFAPKGTKALYVEPFSECGNGKAGKWDGKYKQYDTSSENETLFQRGTSFQVVEHNVNEYGKHYIKIVVVSQDYESSEYTKKRKAS